MSHLLEIHTYSRLSSATRGSLLLALFIICTLGTASISVWEIRKAQLDGRMAASKALVESANSTMHFYYDQFVNGKLTENEAQKAALTVVSTMTHNQNDFVFAYGFGGGKCVLLVNKVRPDLVGVDRCDVVSPDGVKYVQAGINVAKAGGGFYAYMWDAGGTAKQARPKVSYALAFEPWHIMLGAGDFVDDILADFWGRFTLLISFAAVCLAVGTSLLTFLHAPKR